ncbi:DUF503 domain-containing protein [Carboxydothermus hydrogenoformans]|uniref:YlxP-like protein n=1 Tax=Carboxydothermus hydrogenoformans (strain ATCC BAA-161 / DSM 6008 / Z-2901) TaxID=246194 RepID=Q3A8R9_CARHZ|nr:DUF503 domain-containing protein [Carboxydothermus hydrogenoformans]ABB15386.1 conserved hypothetical protein [Carboxydothermus hydrogenoformans Z-2901]
MIIGVLTLELYIPQSQSLKEKRMVLKSITEKIKHNYNVSIAEVGNQNLWQRSTLALAAVSLKKDDIEKVFAKIENIIEQNGNVLITERFKEFI